VAVGALEAPTGLTVEELGRRAIQDKVVRFNGLDLAHWLLKEGLAEIHDGRLTPSRRGVELAELLAGG
jgi:hypothetical protein